MKTISNRFNYLLDKRGLTTYTLCKETGLNNSALGRLSMGKITKPNSKTVDAICNYFNINKTWFLTGSGSIAKPIRDVAVTNLINGNSEIYNGNRFISLDTGQKIMLVPFVDDVSYEGFIQRHNDVDFLEQLPYHPILVDMYHKGDYFAFRVIGDAMDDGTKKSIEHNSIVTGRVIYKHLWNSKFQSHNFQNYINSHYYIVVHKKGIFVREIIDQDLDKRTLTIHSINKLYDDFVLSLDDCLMILSIVDVIKKP